MRLKYNPHSIIIDQTTFCNQCCSFCHRSLDNESSGVSKRENSVLPFFLYTKIIDEAAKIDSVRWLSLCGPMGEPLLVHDLIERLEYAKAKSHFKTILINSNGQALEKHAAERLLRSCSDLQFSVDSIREETYAKIHCGGNLQKVIQNIIHLYDVKKCLSGPSAAIRVRFTENEHNVGEWKEFEAFFDSISDDVFRVRVHSFMGRMEQYRSKLGATICNQPFKIINFNFRGELTTCCINWRLEPTFGSIADSSLQKIWESSAIEKWREMRISTTCNLCGGLGTFQQRADNEPSQQEIFMAEEIERLGEKKYYENNGRDNDEDRNILAITSATVVSRLKKRLYPLFKSLRGLPSVMIRKR